MRERKEKHTKKLKLFTFVFYLYKHKDNVVLLQVIFKKVNSVIFYLFISEGYILYKLFYFLLL